ncbi:MULTISPECIES: DUF981 family protein [unclassified Modestobacter]
MDSDMVNVLAAEDQGLTIDWENLPTYNTVMSVAGGAGLLLLVALGYLLVKRRAVAFEGWALAFGVLGLILTPTGLHMTLTWPLAPDFPFDNIVFGETSLAFGVMLLATSFYLWKRSASLTAEVDPLASLARTFLPFSLFAVGMGLGCFGIAAAGWRYTLFVAPPEEPISGNFADQPMLEATFISMLFVLVGIGAVLLPLVLRARRLNVVAWIAGICWAVSGAIFFLFGALNFFTHIGLIVNTM